MSISPKPTSWKTRHFIISAGEHAPPINIVPYLVDPDGCNLVGPDGRPDPFQALKQKPPLTFPPNVYPPNWKDRAIIEQAFQLAAKEAGFAICRDGTVVARNVSRLVCSQGRPYKANKATATTFQTNVFKPMAVGEQRSEAVGLKQDRFINRALSHRTNDDKIDRTKKGFRGASRKRTLKPPSGHLCSFRIRLQLKPGHYWFINHGTGSCVHLCEQCDPSERRARVTDMQPETKKIAGSVAHYGTLGQARSILNDLTKENYSNVQVAAIRQKYDCSQGLTLPPIATDNQQPPLRLSDAAKLINFLDNQPNVPLEKKSYIAYYHHVTDTSLLTVRAGDHREDRKRCREDNRREEQLRSVMTECPTEDE